MEAFGPNINDRSRMPPWGKQRILVDGYQLPLDFKNGLPYLRCRKPTEAELDLLPLIIMTSDVERDPTLYDNSIAKTLQIFMTQQRTRTSIKTLIAMGRIAIELLLNTVHYL
jgi:hypothetical protein